MNAIFQTTFLNEFSWMKMCKFRLKFHWSLFPMAKLTIFQNWFAWPASSHYLNQWWLVYWRIYASLGFNELITITKSLRKRTGIRMIDLLDIELIIKSYSTGISRSLVSMAETALPWIIQLGLCDIMTPFLSKSLIAPKISRHNYCKTRNCVFAFIY